MHTDESINGYITGELLAGDAFHYDPKDRHGPALYLVAEPLVRLCGARKFSDLTEIQLRLTPVLAGTVTVLLFGAGVEMFGFIPCLVAALLWGFAPLPVYYNRYFIHESLFVAATLGLILSGWRSLKKWSLFPAAIAGGCAALMLACKETAAIHFFTLAVAAACVRVWNAGTGPRFGTGRSSDGSGTGEMPPNPALFKVAVTAVAVFLAAAVLLFTWFGQNWAALGDILRAIPNFAARAGGEGHEKPFWYYAWLLDGGWSGAALLLVAGFGLWHLIRHPASETGLALTIYALLTFVVYSAIPYKTPWLALNFWLPLALLAGFAVEWFWMSQPGFSARVLMLTVFVGIGVLIFHDTRERVFLMPAAEKNPYAYAHTGEDLLRLPARLEALVRQDKMSHPRIAVVAADPWPLPWYLRKYSQVGYWQPGQDPGAADIFLTSTDVPVGLAAKLQDFRPEFFGWRPNVLLILWVPPNEPSATDAPPPSQIP
jgi:uncharacterized protein (TIGR03663 family)